MKLQNMTFQLFGFTFAISVTFCPRQTHSLWVTHISAISLSLSLSLTIIFRLLLHCSTFQGCMATQQQIRLHSLDCHSTQEGIPTRRFSCDSRIFYVNDCSENYKTTCVVCDCGNSVPVCGSNASNCVEIFFVASTSIVPIWAADMPKINLLISKQ
jgi:hypothetical protein